MRTMMFAIYLFALYWIFLYVDKKYQFVNKFKNKSNKKFNLAINILSILSFVFYITTPIWQDYFNYYGRYVSYIKGIILLPLVFRYFISSKISEVIETKKREMKNKKVELTFCYYCGSDINGNNTCPSCGKELEIGD